ncbi:P-loop NTPase family protein [Virgibacillus senegalensis]|uniref:ATP synthase subunit B n=1 Tax=Virgibacillus senegalensis TaxID=1499679 RepID=UPI00069DF5FE|nr:ATP synthase subunit B [Virgibacillus senegalensis]
MDDFKLNVDLLRKRVPNLTVAARSVGLRPATVSNLCTGKIPVARAEVRTLVRLASLASCKLDDLIIQKGGETMIETGIKVLDLFAPLVKGGKTGLVARAGMGQQVMLAELFFRLKKQGFRTLFLADGRKSSIADAIAEAEFYSSSTDEIFDYIEASQPAEVILGVDRSIFLSDKFYRLEEQLNESGLKNVTFAVIDISGEAVDEDLPYGPLETLWEFDMELAAKHAYPAVNPLTSISTMVEELNLDNSHMEVQQHARKVIRRSKELAFVVEQRGITSLSESDTTIYERGKKLAAFLTQPLFVAEEFSGKAGKSVPLSNTLENVKAIMEGKADNLTVEKLEYIGELTV